MATIKAIESRSVHQIQSGQVIVDLSSVVKELVENSLDAGATSIEIRFKNQGLESIEVQDNGKGISPDDYDTIALKHYTSKLSTYDDLGSLQTFGFRGEALSSLCALSKFHILTAREADGAIGKRLDFEVSGKLKDTSISAAQKGTTVFVEDLFYNLPVRRKELEKNVKREYGKVISYLYAYACISVGVRFNVSNQMPKGRRIPVFSTQANLTTKDNITNIFGAKASLALVELHLRLEMEPSKGVGFQPAKSMDVQVEGHISKPIFGEGRQAPDRQMFFVNSRPCQLPQVAKAFNEVYKSFNVSQSPFIFANLILDTNAYDVNVSPDKRTILLHDQTAMLESLKAALKDMFDDVDHTVPHASLPEARIFANQRTATPRQMSLSSFTAQNVYAKQAAPVIEHDARHSSSQEEEEIEDDYRIPPRAATPTVARETLSVDDALPSSTIPELISNQSDVEEQPSSNRESAIGRPIIHPEAISPDDDMYQGIKTSSSAIGSQKRAPGPVQNAFDRMRPKRSPLQVAEITVGDTTTTTIIGSDTSSKRRRVHDSRTMQIPQKMTGLARSLRQQFGAPGSQNELEHEEEVIDDRPQSSVAEHLSNRSELSANCDENESDASDHCSESSHEGLFVSDAGTSKAVSPLGQVDSAGEAYVDERQNRRQEEERVAQLIQEAENVVPEAADGIARRAARALKNGSNRKDSTLHLATTILIFATDIEAQMNWTDSVSTTEESILIPSQQAVVNDDIHSSEAEAKLILTVAKADFGNMRIAGQFNLGFILAVRPSISSSHNDDLFIIDQHAADEKFNYERLQRTVTLQSQRLVRPKHLELTAFEQEIILNHTDALKANGFEVETTEMPRAEDGDEEISQGSTSRSFRLLTLPTSYHTTFGLSDLEELIHLLSESGFSSGNGHIPRPTKVQKMLAMRACRSSIMVGKTLTTKQMVRVARNMGEMEKPWNCPHGRPTMRHLAQLGAWRSWRESESMDDLVDNSDASLSNVASSSA